MKKFEKLLLITGFDKNLETSPDPRKAPCLTTCYYKGPCGCGRPQIMEFEYVADEAI